MADYRFVTNHRQEIVNVLKDAFYNATKRDLPVFHVHVRDPRPYTTATKDIKIGCSRFLTLPYQMRAFDEAKFQKEAES